MKGGKFASPDAERSGFVLGTGTNRSTEVLLVITLFQDRLVVFRLILNSCSSEEK